MQFVYCSLGLMLMENPEEFAGVLDNIRFNQDGLVPAIVQDVATKAVLMMAWMNRATLELTLREGRTVFWSRSRQKVWRKGDTSGERQWLREAYYDCDADAVLFIVKQDGEGACHLKKYSCFHMPFTFHIADD